MASLETPELSTTGRRPARGRGRPRAADVIVLNQHITAVAREIFFAVGFGNATMDSIAQRAQVSKETLYSRFPNKSVLFESVVKSQLEAWGKLATKHNPIVVTRTLEEAIRHHVETQVQVTLSPEFMDVSRVLMAEAHSFPELAKTMFTSSYEGRIVAVAKNIRKYAEIDGIPARDPESAAEALRSLVSGWLSVMLIDGRIFTPDEVTAFIDRVTEIFMASRPAW